MKILGVEGERGGCDGFDGDVEREVGVIEEEIVQEDGEFCGLKRGGRRVGGVGDVGSVRGVGGLRRGGEKGGECWGVDASGVSIRQSEEKVVCVTRGGRCGSVVLFDGGVEAYDRGEGGVEDFEEACALVGEVGFLKGESGVWADVDRENRGVIGAGGGSGFDGGMDEAGGEVKG